jgi:hypothetical protein
MIMGFDASFYLGLLAVLVTGSGGAARLPAQSDSVSGQPAVGILEISFLFNKAEGVVPSYQIAIWLENEEGRLVKTLFVSEYLAGPGIGLEVVCPDWVKQAHWDKVDDSEAEAVTGPTPPIGVNTMKFDCRQRAIMPGNYRYCLQAHINENYNILYRGRITVGKQASEDSAEAFYSPRKHPLASEILHAVRARYVLQEEFSPLIKKDKP